MAIEPLDTAPSQDSFKPLSEHEEQTPATFFGGPAVLYCHVLNATVLVSRTQLAETPVLKRLLPQNSAESSEEQQGEQEEDVQIAGVDVWVSSRNLVLFGADKGVTISYPSIALHAMGTHESRHLDGGAAPVVFLQINVHDQETTNSDDEMRTLDLTIHATEIVAQPTASSSSRLQDDADADAGAGDAADAPQVTAVQALFEALSACADLHPDPNEEDEADGEEGSMEPGAGGWITAENMHEFVDEDGTFVPPSASLGPGAGTVRAREGDEDGDDGDQEDTQQNGVNGHGNEETKWQRTE